MEQYGSSNLSPYESPPSVAAEADPKTKKNRKKTPELVAPINERKQKDSREIARSLLGSNTEAASPTEAFSLFNKREADNSDEFTADERDHANRSIAKNHLESLVQADPATIAELAPANDFLELVADGNDPEVAFSEVAAEAGIDEADLAEALAAIPAEEFDDDNVGDDPEGFIDPAELNEGQIDWQPNDDEVAPVAGGAGSDGPIYPGSRSMGSPPSGPPPHGHGPNPVPTPQRPVAPVAATAPAAANVLPPAAHNYYYRRSSTGNALAVGIASYLYGRHRGRIKAEKRLAPEQRRLEQQVTHLERDITRKEQVLVIAQARHTAERPANNKAVAQERAQPGRQETRLHLQKPERAEQLGHIILATEAPKVIEHTRFEKPKHLRQAFRPEAVRTMRRNELLELSEKITVEGATLRRVYESNLIGEKQLRHLVSEYLAGKDIHRSLRREMVEREIDFERDPQLRDRIRSRLAASEGAGGGLEQLLAKAGALPETERQYEKAADSVDQTKAAAKHKRRRQVADTAMVTAIVVLAILVIALITTRR